MFAYLHTPFSTSLTSLVVSVDVKHHVCLLLQDIFVFNLRQEPVLLLNTDDGDFAPYSLREQDKLRRLFLVNFSPLEADEHEAAIRKEVSEEWKLNEA